MSKPPPIDQRLGDLTAERVRQSHAQAIRDLQDSPAIDMQVIQGVVLPSGAGVLVSHRLGRAPKFIGISAIRGAATAGVVDDLGVVDGAGNPIDRTKQLALRARSYGATITVDVQVM